MTAISTAIHNTGVPLIAIFKGQLVVDRFMGLCHVSGFWRPPHTGYLLLTGTALADASFCKDKDHDHNNF